MIIQKKCFLYAVLFTIAILFSDLHAQSNETYIDPNLSAKIYRKTLVMNSNNTESILGNWGIFGKMNDPYSGVWPKGTTHGHVHEMTMLVVAEVTDTTGTVVHIASQSYGGTNSAPDGSQYWWNPIPGYANEHRQFVKTDGTIDSTATIAHSADPSSWPASWPGKDYKWNGTWNGYFGQNQFSADDEMLYLMDDHLNKKFGYFPVLGNHDSRGLGLQCETRAFQWAHPLAQDLIFVHFMITNTSDINYNQNVYLGAFADTHPGGMGSANDMDNYSIPDNMVYAWAYNNIGIWTKYRDIKPGYMAWKYLESPGNPHDGLDNNLNGVTDEVRTDNPGTQYVGTDAIVKAFCAVVDTAKFMAAYGYTNLEQIPAIHAGVWWSGDENANWDVKTDDVGSDGIGPDDPSYKGPDTDGTEKNGKPDQGEPNYGKTDKNESDQIGLTSFYSPLYGTFDVGQDEQVWQFIQPGTFQTPALNANNLWVFASGLFDMFRYQTERFSVVWLFGEDENAIFNNAKIAQIIYENSYRFSKPPSQPIVNAVAGDKKVTIYWENRAESSRDPIYGYDFEGYKVYRGTDAQLSEAKVITDSYGNVRYSSPIAQYDLVDKLKGLHPVALGSETGPESSRGIQYNMGTDSGLKYSFTDSTVKNGFTYYYAVVAYDKGYYNDEDNGGTGLDKLQGVTDRKLGKMSPSECAFSISYNAGELVGRSVNTAIVTPNAISSNYKAGYIVEADDQGYIYSTTSAQETTGKIKAQILDPDILKKDNAYEITFADTIGSFGEYLLQSYTVKNTTPGHDTTLLSKVKIPVNMNTGVQNLNWVAPAVDGMQFNFANTSVDVTKIRALSGWSSESHTNLVVTPATMTPAGVFSPKNFIIEVTDTVGAKDSKNVPVYFRIYDKVTLQPVSFQVAKNPKNGKIDNGMQLYIKALDGTGEPLNVWTLRFTAPKDTNIVPLAGDKYNFVCDVPFNRNIKFQFHTISSITKPVTEQTLNLVKVVPNPYIVSAKWEKAAALTGRGERKIYFNHLPAECTIKLYTQNGTLIKTLRHSGVLSDGSETWDLTTSEGLEVAFGIYVYHIDSPGIGSKIGTLGIIN